MIHQKGNPANSKPVSMIERYTDRISLLKNVTNTSQSLETILGVSIEETDIGVEVYSDGTVHYSPEGDASSANGKLPVVRTIHGGKTSLDKVRLYAASSTPVTFIVFSVQQD